MAGGREKIHSAGPGTVFRCNFRFHGGRTDPRNVLPAQSYFRTIPRNHSSDDISPTAPPAGSTAVSDTFFRRCLRPRCGGWCVNTGASPLLPAGRWCQAGRGKIRRCRCPLPKPQYPVFASMRQLAECFYPFGDYTYAHGSRKYTFEQISCCRHQSAAAPLPSPLTGPTGAAAPFSRSAGPTSGAGASPTGRFGRLFNLRYSSTSTPWAGLPTHCIQSVAYRRPL